MKIISIDIPNYYNHISILNNGATQLFMSDHAASCYVIPT